MRGIPAETYNNLEQICASVTIVGGDPMGDAQRVGAGRAHIEAGVAEASRGIGPQHPIVDESGENRGLTDFGYYDPSFSSIRLNSRC